MPVSLARRGVWAVGAMVVLATLFVLGLPLVASTQIVRDGIAYQMSSWSGYRVRLDDTPEIRVWPAFRAELNDVTFSSWSETSTKPVLQAERIEVDLSALAALKGEVVFTKMRFIRPVLRLSGEEGSLHLAPPQGWGRLARSVEAARGLVSAAPAEPDTSALPADSFGEIEFADARIVSGSGDRNTDVVTSLTGELDWPALNRQASLSATGIWNGESVSLEASSTQPLMLLGGGNAPLTFSLRAAPANASFKGVARLQGDGFIDGQFDFTAPSLNRLMEWVHSASLPGRRVGQVTVAAKVVGDRTRLKFEDASLGLDGSAGRGLLDVSMGPGRPAIAGTLAFDKLNLGALLAAFSPFPAEDLPVQASQPPMSASAYDIDLRFSAASANIGSATLADVAAAAKAKDGLSTFDISDATAFDGTFQFGIRTDKQDLVEMRLTAEEIDTGKLAAALGAQRLIPQARGSFSAMVKGTGRDLETVLATAEGTVSASFGAGTIPGLSLEAFLQRSAQGDFFPLAALAEGALPVDGMEIKAVLSQGIARIEKAEIRSGQHQVSFDGLVPIAGRGLALYGTLTALESAASPPRSPLMFFVGGSWSAPFIASFFSPAPTGDGANP